MPMPVTTSLAGMVVNGPPNVCKTPPLGAPAPLPSLGLPNALIPSTMALSVFISGAPTAVVGAQGMTLPVDAAGLLLGNTGAITGPLQLASGSSKLVCEGRPAAVLGCSAEMNNENTTGQIVAPSQASVLAAQ